MIHDLSFFSGRAKAEPRHDPWPPTWRLPSGAIRVEASFKEPGRQKLVDKATKAVAFLALAFVVLGHEQWPWPELVALVLNVIASPGPVPVTEQVAAWLFVGLLGIGMIVGMFRLLLAVLGIDQGKIAVEFHRDQVTIDGRKFDRQSAQGFEVEAHHLGKVEAHSEKRLGQPTNLYYRDAYTIIFRFGERRIEIADIVGRKSAASLTSRFQQLETHKIAASCRHTLATKNLRS